MPSTSESLPRLSDDRSLGVSFHHVNGMFGQRYFCEMVGPGGALFDVDGDGDLDLFLVQGSALGGVPLSESIFPPDPNAPQGDRLLINQLKESGELRFRDTTEESGISESEYGMGCTVGDVDGDGDPDIYVTNFGRDRLWLNQGDTTFVEASTNAGLAEDDWTTSAVFFDYDLDGDLDLFVCTYVDYRLENHKPCYSETSAIDYCGPSSFRSQPDRLYLNQGDGVFQDVTSTSRIGTEVGAGLGVVTADFDADGLLDIYVANDGTPNRLWKNLGDGTFVDTGLLAGCAYNRDGRAEASMGIEASDFDADGDEDVFLTHLTDETNTLYKNDGNGVFEDVSAPIGLGVPSRAFTGFGTATFDYDLDGFLDLFVANGAVKTIEALAAKGDPYPLRQRNQLFRNRGDGRFEEVLPQTEPVLKQAEVSRGVLSGDINNDGAIDLVVLNNSALPQILIGTTPKPTDWIGFDVRRPDGQRPAIGTLIELKIGSETSRIQRVRVAASYLSANDPRIIFGLRNQEPAALSAILHHPGGLSESFDGLKPGKYQTLIQGQGKALEVEGR